MRPHSDRWPIQRGFSLIEVLVTLLILLVGLLGLAGLLKQSQISEVESYQRVQALELLQDMVSRIRGNRVAAASYVTGTTPLGVGNGDCSDANALAELDKCRWDALLKGASEVANGREVGGMLGARGCVTQYATAATEPQRYLVQVSWQGMAATVAPPSFLLCGKDAYGPDANRRTVAAVLQIGVTN